MGKTHVGYHKTHAYGGFSKEFFYTNKSISRGDNILVISGDSPNNTKYFLEGKFEVLRVDEGEFILGGKLFKYRCALGDISVPSEPILLSGREEISSEMINRCYVNGRGIVDLHSEHEAVFENLLAEYLEPSVRRDLEELNISEISETERQQLIDARLGQGKFRQDVLRLWDNACPVTGISIPALLVASHIKPWRLSTNRERLSPDNGIILAPHLDKAFDKFLISFDDDGYILINKAFKDDLRKIGISSEIKINFPFAKDPSRNLFWDFHQREFYSGNSR
jgi:hypothetical protein